MGSSHPDTPRGSVCLFPCPRADSSSTRTGLGTWGSTLPTHPPWRERPCSGEFLGIHRRVNRRSRKRELLDLLMLFVKCQYLILGLHHDFVHPGLPPRLVQVCLRSRVGWGGAGVTEDPPDRVSGQGPRRRTQGRYLPLTIATVVLGPTQDTTESIQRGAVSPGDRHKLYYTCVSPYPGRRPTLSHKGRPRMRSGGEVGLFVWWDTHGPVRPRPSGVDQADRRPGTGTGPDPGGQEGPRVTTRHGVRHP